MRQRAVRVGAAAVLVAVVAAACGGGSDSGPSANRREVFADLTTEVVVPLYDRLAATTADLADASAALCAGTGSVEATKAAWDEAWEAWNTTKAFRFGPLTTLRTSNDVAFMVDTDKIDRLLAGSNPAVGPPFTPASLDATGLDVRGLEGAEHVLFVRDPSDPDTCAYLAATSALVAEAAGQAATAWTDGLEGGTPYADEVQHPGGDVYADSQAVLDDFVNGMAMALSEATKELAAAEAAPPGERDTRGGHNGDRVRAGIAGAEAAYDGSLDGTDADGIGALVAAMSTDTDERVRSALTDARAAVRDLPSDLNEATPAEVERAYTKVRAASRIVRAEVASLLGVTLSLSDSDGDS